MLLEGKQDVKAAMDEKQRIGVIGAAGRRRGRKDAGAAD